MSGRPVNVLVSVTSRQRAAFEDRYPSAMSIYGNRNEYEYRLELGEDPDYVLDELDELERTNKIIEYSYE